MDLTLSTQETEALSTAIAAKAMETLVPRIVAIEKALQERVKSPPEPKPQAMQALQPVQPEKPMESKYMDLKNVKALTSLGETTIWRLEKAGKFPLRIKLSSRRVGWYRPDVISWIEDRRAA
jgi:prophage regulatory protein